MPARVSVMSAAPCPSHATRASRFARARRTGSAAAVGKGKIWATGIVQPSVRVMVRSRRAIAWSRSQNLRSGVLTRQPRKSDVSHESAKGRGRGAHYGQTGDAIGDLISTSPVLRDCRQQVQRGSSTTRTPPATLPGDTGLPISESPSFACAFSPTRSAGWRRPPIESGPPRWQ